MATKHERFNKLIKIGMLKFEAGELCKVQYWPVYFARLCKERKTRFKQHIAEGKSYADWETLILFEYEVHNWVRKKKGVVVLRRGLPIADAWSMFRAFEDKYKDRKPEYESPWEKKARDFRDFQPKVERTLARMARRTATAYG